LLNNFANAANVYYIYGLNFSGVLSIIPHYGLLR